MYNPQTVSEIIFKESTIIFSNNEVFSSYISLDNVKTVSLF